MTKKKMLLEFLKLGVMRGMPSNVTVHIYQRHTDYSMDGAQLRLYEDNNEYIPPQKFDTRELIAGLRASTYKKGMPLISPGIDMFMFALGDSVGIMATPDNNPPSTLQMGKRSHTLTDDACSAILEADKVTSLDRGREILRRVLVDYTGNIIRIAATDGRAVYERICVYDGVSVGDEVFTIAPRTLSYMKVFRGHARCVGMIGESPEGRVVIKLYAVDKNDENVAEMIIANPELMAHAAGYPDYRKAFMDHPTMRLQVSAQDMSRIFNKAKLWKDGKEYARVDLTASVGKNGVTLSTKSEHGSLTLSATIPIAEHEYPVGGCGIDDYRVRMDANIMARALSTMRGETVNMHFPLTPKEPIEFTGVHTSERWLCMPLRPKTLYGNKDNQEKRDVH